MLCQNEVLLDDRAKARGGLVNDTSTSDELHPTVAALAGTLAPSAQGALAFPEHALQRAREALLVDGDEATAHVAILAARIARIAGDLGRDALEQLGRLVGEVLAAAHAPAAPVVVDPRAYEGILGRTDALRAPRAEATQPSSTPRPRRGLEPRTQG